MSDNYEWPTKAHRIELLVFGLNDCAEYDVDAVIGVIVSGLRGNFILHKMKSETILIDFHDDHPFNYSNTTAEEIDKIFREVKK